MVDIVIPIYKKDPTLDDTTAINQAFKLLKGYDITFVHPKSLDITNYKKVWWSYFQGFQRHLFRKYLRLQSIDVECRILWNFF